ncbi:hypothetical protein PFISCL1PPCAC_13762 [Pristionchus fissidentatus]|uniref:G protein-coupled receptor n=1 Tax=Pristionchus fissidentatus TaxID=1538716 RepID=A0AAV5VV98_9BILA|nr:hypothetical protein PFISCL1PPCAC_13762 [Pristionchus fissidentatus]
MQFTEANEDESLQEYSILLLNTALIDQFSILAHYFVDGRLFISSTTVLCISSGPCRLVSDRACAVVTGFMNVNMIHSTSIIAASFWYRTRILREKGLVGRWRVRSLTVVLFLPHLAHIAGFVWTLSDRQELARVVDAMYEPGHAQHFGLHGFANLSEPLPAILTAYLVLFPIFTNSFSVRARNQVSKVRKVRPRPLHFAHSLHRSVEDRGLTIHAVLPIFVMLGMTTLSVAQINYGVHSEDIEGIDFDFAVLPALINPLITLYFVRPYRE